MTSISTTAKYEEYVRILTSAADLLEKTGWTRHTYARDARDLPVTHSDRVDEIVCYCASGALNMAASGLPWCFHPTTSGFVHNLVAENLGSHTPPGVGGVVVWNDVVVDSADDVIDLFRYLAADIKSKYLSSIEQE